MDNLSSACEQNSLIEDIGANASNTELRIKLHKENTLKNTLRRVLAEKDKFGHNVQCLDDKLFILNPVSSRTWKQKHTGVKDLQEGQEEEQDFGDTRVNIVAMYLKNILEACG